MAIGFSFWFIFCGIVVVVLIYYIWLNRHLKKSKIKLEGRYNKDEDKSRPTGYSKEAKGYFTRGTTSRVKSNGERTCDTGYGETTRAGEIRESIKTDYTGESNSTNSRADTNIDRSEPDIESTSKSEGRELLQDASLIDDGKNSDRTIGDKKNKRTLGRRFRRVRRRVKVKEE